MPSVNDHLQALQRAKAAGDTEAADYIRSQLLAAQTAEDRAAADPTAGMTGTQRFATNLLAGAERGGIGLGQLVLPKSLERKVGITDDAIAERRARDKVLADSIPGGTFLQGVGEAAPTFLIPGGTVARGLGMIPKIGAAVKAAGLGSRVLPTAIGEGAAIGAAQGAITPTTSDEGVAGNVVAGLGAGAVLPAGLAGVGKAVGAAARPLVPSLQRSALSRKLGEALDTSPNAQADLAGKIQTSGQRVVDAPQSLATVTQSPEVARMELAARANPKTSASWQGFDETAGNAKWKALSDALGNEETVKAAKKETDAYARDVIPEVMKSVRPELLSQGLAKITTTVKEGLDTAVKEADPARQEVFRYVSKALDEGGGSARMLWNIHKTLKSWMEGTPPPGMEGTRGAKMDVPIRETVNQIDDTLNSATGQTWQRFLDRYSTFARKEGQQKAGQNIRNAFFDETLITPRGATTAAGNPSVTRAKLEQALLKHGKNEFGEVLDPAQRNVVDQVLTDLRGEEILGRAKSAMTGKGGSQTAPLEALMRSSGSRVTGGWVSDIATALSKFSAGKQQDMLNQILQSPADALALIRQAERMKGPLSDPEKRLVQATRAVLSSPAMLISINQQANTPGEQPGE